MCLVSFARDADYAALDKLKQWDGTPKWAYVAICDDCSHQCSWCYGGFDGQRGHQMSCGDFARLLAKLRAMGIRQVTLAGGEPTEHPQFRSFVELAEVHDFNLNLASHGEHIDAELADFLGRHHVRQVQLNWQGRAHHDRIHKRPGSYERSARAVKLLLAAGVEVTVTVTVGQYNFAQLGAIFAEAVELGVTRLRVWDATGRGNAFRKQLSPREIFSEAKERAAEHGFTHVLSYDPAFEGDVHVPCLQLANLYMYISSRGRLEFCAAAADGLTIIDCLDPEVTPSAILARYLEVNRQIQGDRAPFCAARGEGPIPLESALDDTLALSEVGLTE